MKFVYDPKLCTMVPEDMKLGREELAQVDRDVQSWLTREMAEQYSYSTNQLAYEFLRTHSEYRQSDKEMIRTAIAKCNNKFMSSSECLHTEVLTSKKGPNFKKKSAQVVDEAVATEEGAGCCGVAADGAGCGALGIGSAITSTGAVDVISSPVLKKSKKKKKSGTEGISFNEMEEIFKLSKEIGIGDRVSDLEDFMKHECPKRDKNLLQALRDYRQELGEDFKISTATESKDAVDVLVSPQITRNMPIVGADGILEEVASEQGPSTGGDCFVQALHNVQRSKDPGVLLVHAIITGRGPIEGCLYNHAWIEEGDIVIDTTMPLFAQGFPKDAYYRLAQVQDGLVFKYNRQQVLDKELEYKTYGPWEDILWQYK